MIYTSGKNVKSGNRIGKVIISLRRRRIFLIVPSRLPFLYFLPSRGVGLYGRNRNVWVFCRREETNYTVGIGMFGFFDVERSQIIRSESGCLDFLT